MPDDPQKPKTDDPYADVVKIAAGNGGPKLDRAVRGGEKLKGVQPELVDHWNNLDKRLRKVTEFYQG